MERLFHHYKPSLPKDALTFPSLRPHGAGSVRASFLVPLYLPVILFPHTVRAAYV
jgi:hypothetical protein